MVKVGFIVEGDTEMVIFKRNENLHKFLSENNIEVVSLQDGKGGNILNAEKLNQKKAICREADAEHIVLITDLEDESCYTNKKSAIDLSDTSLILISRKAFEAWFLADTDTIRKVINSTDYNCDNPENINNPYEEIKGLSRQNNNGRGVSKVLLAGKMNRNGFNILSAANHPNCPSAKYFVGKLQQLAAEKN